jgi:hypothetical protein
VAQSGKSLSNVLSDALASLISVTFLLFIRGKYDQSSPLHAGFAVKRTQRARGAHPGQLHQLQRPSRHSSSHWPFSVLKRFVFNLGHLRNFCRLRSVSPVAAPQKRTRQRCSAAATRFMPPPPPATWPNIVAPLPSPPFPRNTSVVLTQCMYCRMRSCFATFFFACDSPPPHPPHFAAISLCLGNLMPRFVRSSSCLRSAPGSR